jgi:Heparinase II/III-like protein
MKRSSVLAVIACLVTVLPSPADVKLEPFTYKENFESRELNAWASYPLWQDTAYDPNLRPGTIVPGDPNLSLLQKVTPYASVDNYAGAQKKLEMWLAPGSLISLRYYLKTHLKPEFIKLYLAAGADGKVGVTVPNPTPNSWQTLAAGYDRIVAENPALQGKTIRVEAVAVLVKFPQADPAVPIYFGLDDVLVHALRPASFRFDEPRMIKLDEWQPFIPEKHFRKGESLRVKGRWPFAAGRVALRISPFTEASRTLLTRDLKMTGDAWTADNIPLTFPEGLYRARLDAFNKNEHLAETEFTFYVRPADLGRNHPRLWFDGAGWAKVRARLDEERFKGVRNDLMKSARENREKFPVEKIVFDIDQFPDDEPLLGNVPRSIYPWYDRINPWKSGLQTNALAYRLADDAQAGAYAKALLVKLSSFPFFLHPWWEKRGQHIYYPVGELGMDLALAYDLVYDLLTESERAAVRASLIKNVISGCHRSYVEDDLVTTDTSNWVAHITGGSIMCQAAIYGDGPEAEPVEPHFTGVILKLAELIDKSSGRDGGYGESLGYCQFTMLSLSKALPALDRTFRIDLSAALRNTYQDFPYAGIIQDKTFFHFGDSAGRLGPLTNWAWYLAKTRDPLLSWLYHFLKDGETLMDVLYPTEGIPQAPPFDRPPVRAFRELGTTVFRSGWAKEDFVFVMRTGAFYNHQHLDQGTFWLADQGRVFIEERHGSTYYDDPIYQSHYTQPVAHSTILIDHNPQSQRTGDPLRFVAGFDDRAFIYHFLDGTKAAFSSGDIGRLYWGKVKEMRRNVLYLKPRTLLMLDTVVPAEKDVDVTLLYQTSLLEDIKAGPDVSSISKGDAALRIHHLAPENAVAEVQETPHYLYTLRNENPLRREGMLTVTAPTAQKPLVLANLLTTEADKGTALKTEKGRGFVGGNLGGREFAFSTDPGQAYTPAGFTTDALAVTWEGTTVFAALCTRIEQDGRPLLSSEEPVTCEISGSSLKYCLAAPARVRIGLSAAPLVITHDGKRTDRFLFDKDKKELTLTLPAGEGLITWK